MQNQKPFWKTVFIAPLILLLISCQPSVRSTPVALDNDVQDIRVQMVEPIRTTAKVEQFPLPNCGGTDRLAQSLGTYASASKSTTIGAKATVTGGGEVGIPETTKLKLEIQVELAYQRTFESANSRIDSIEMSAAKESHVVYTIVWEKQTFESIVRYSADGNVYEVPYTYRLSVPKIDASYNVQCPTREANATSNPLPPSPLATTPEPTQGRIVTTPTSYPTPRPANSIPENVVAQLNFGQGSIDDVNRCLDKAHEGPRPFVSFNAGEQIPSNALIATDYGGGGKNWNEFPVTPICYTGSWGLFRSNESYIAPYEGAYWIIIP